MYTEVTITTFNDNQAHTFIGIALLLLSLPLSKEHQVKFAASCESSEQYQEKAQHNQRAKSDTFHAQHHILSHC